MSWDDFDIFCHVALHGSFSGAARALDRPKSSISTAISRLETALNARLMERTTRRVRLTEAGAMLYQGAAPIMTELRDLATEVRNRENEISGTLRIAAPYEYGAHHLGRVSAQLLSRYRDLQIVLDVEHTPVDMIDRNYDIAFSMTDRELADSSIVASRVFTLERGLFAAPALLARAPELGEPDDLRHVPLLCRPGETEWIFEEGAAERISIPVDDPCMRSANAGVRKQVAVAGLGVLRVTKTFCETEMRAGILQPVLEAFACQPLRVYALLPARRLMPLKVRVFLEELAAMEMGAI